MSDQTLDLGVWLKAQRESRGITLDALAASMKLQRSVLADLERNDISRWPPGIYGRAYVRQYARLVGLPPEAVLQQFCELCPEPPPRLPWIGSTAASDFEREGGSELRLTLEDAASLGRSKASARVADVAGNVGFVLAVGGALALTTGLAFWTVTGVVALAWYLASAVYGGKVSLRRVIKFPQRRPAPSQAPDIQPLVLQVAGTEQPGTHEAFERHGAADDEENALPLPTSRQVH